MGEMADYYNEIYSIWGTSQSLYQNCYKKQRLHKCKYCGEGSLNWFLHQGKWRLGVGNTIHQCPVNPLKEIK